VWVEQRKGWSGVISEFLGGLGVGEVILGLQFRCIGRKLQSALES